MVLACTWPTRHSLSLEAWMRMQAGILWIELVELVLMGLVLKLMIQLIRSSNLDHLRFSLQQLWC